MIAPFRHGIDVIVARSGGTDNHGDPKPGSEATIAGVVIYDAAVDESINGTTLDADFVMLGPYGIDVKSEDVIYRASDADRAHPLYAKGDAWNVKHPMTGWEAGSRVLLTHAKGGL